MKSKEKRCRVINFLDWLNMYKIAMFSCERDRLDQLNVDYKYVFSFDDCLCNTKCEVFTIRCKICRYNVVGFARNYFASVVCSCYQTDKNLICSHCKQLLHALNFSTLKVCIKERDLPKEFDVMEIDNYLTTFWQIDNFFIRKKIIILWYLLTRLIGEIFLKIRKRCNNFLIFSSKKKVMVIFEVDFIFCCPCFVPDIFYWRFIAYKKNFEFACFVHRRNPRKVFDIDDSKKEGSMLITCFEHFFEAMYFDTFDCLHYYRATFYQVVVGNSPYPKKKCYSCYRRSFNKLLKHSPRFVVSS